MSQATSEPTTTEILGKVVEAIAAVQDAEQTVVEEGVKLVAHLNDPAAHGVGVAENIVKEMPKPVWNGTALSFSNAHGVVTDPVDLKGEKGLQGPQGVNGDTGAAGLQGVKGDKGDKGETGPQGGQGLQGVKGDKGNTPPLSDSISSISQVDAASSLAVKTAYDKGVEAKNMAMDALTPRTLVSLAGSRASPIAGGATFAVPAYMVGSGRLSVYLAGLRCLPGTDAAKYQYAEVGTVGANSTSIKWHDAIPTDYDIFMEVR